MSRTLLGPDQLNLRELFAVANILKAKGFDVKSEGDRSDLLIHLNNYDGEDNDLLFTAFDDKDSRQEILQKINDSNFSLTHQTAIKLFDRDDIIPDRSRYSYSFEWYIGELMIRKFAAFSSSYGVEVNDIYRLSATAAEPGDFDTLVISRDVNVIYFECKTGGFNKNKILKCIERSIALHCEFNIMFVGNLNVTSLKGCLLGAKHPLINNPRLTRISIRGNSRSEVYNWGNCYFVEAKGDITEQLKTVMRINAAWKVNMSYSFRVSPDTYNKIGYEMTEIK